MMYAFISYQTADKVAAGQLQLLLGEIGIGSFLAHEDIQVSEEWRLKIMEELGKADLFIALLSANYYQSVWCVQESGIAAFRDGVAIIPLSLDGTVPQGFFGHIQSTKVEAGQINLSQVLPGIAKRNAAFVIDLIIGIIGGSGSFRSAEANFALILPFVGKATNEQVATLLNVSAGNGQVLHANLVASKYLPPLMESHGHLVDEETRSEILHVLARYAK